MSAITVKFPAPLPAEIPCPICRFEEGKRGKGCIACEFEGKINLTVDAKIPIQRAHIIQYVANNMSAVSQELTRLYGLVPKVETTEVIETENGQFEIVQVSSLGGAVWIANRLDELAAPKYLFNHQDLEIFKGGFEVE
ncbi:MAG: hypothetical protein CMF74_18375 [Maricaulis sp.]|jgi:hypothetical protein|nr:hypothetical protein [Maricaulis sp.]|tara:strand:+ start:929 stop:1342 length:414 start_codon:yes stop_codon:yes gene_type:complete